MQSIRNGDEHGHICTEASRHWSPRKWAMFLNQIRNPAREIDHVARVSEDSDADQDSSVDQERSVRLSVNLSIESGEILRTLIRRKGLTITEGIRRAIAVWRFVEDENSKGNQIAVIEHDGSIRKVVLL